MSVFWAPFGVSSASDLTRIRLDSPMVFQLAAAGGETLEQMNASAATEIDAKLDPDLRNTCILWAGTNDMLAGGSNVDGATAYARATQFISERQAAGWDDVVVLTTLPQGSNATFETRRSAFNMLLRDNADLLGIHLIDVGADPTLGDYADAEDLTYYQADKLHLTLTGRLIVADVVAAGLGEIGIT